MLIDLRDEEICVIAAGGNIFSIFDDGISNGGSYAALAHTLVSYNRDPVIATPQATKAAIAAFFVGCVFGILSNVESNSTSPPTICVCNCSCPITNSHAKNITNTGG